VRRRQRKETEQPKKAIAQPVESAVKARPPKRPQTETVKIPHDPVNEQVLIAAAIVSPSTRAKLVTALPADGFFAKGHAAIWQSLCEIERRKLHYDPATVRQLSGGEVDTDYVDALITNRPALPPNLAHHVECFLWDRQRIGAIKGGPVSSLLEALQDPTTEPERVRALGNAIGEYFKGGTSQLKYLRDSAQVHAESMRRIRARRSGIAVYPYGLDGFDTYEDGMHRMVPGLEPTQVTLVVGLSGTGKTTVANQIVLAQANAGRKVLHGAWEQDAETNLELLAAMSCGVPRTRLRMGQITDEEESALDAEMARLRELVKFCDLPFDRDMAESKKRPSNERNLDEIHRHVAESGCEIAVFDLWIRALVATEPQDVERALWRQLGIAKATRTHNILLHHLTAKDVERREDKRPTREAIKGTGAWVDIADTIIGAHRPALWKNVEDDSLQLLVLKQRYGKWPLCVEFDHDPATGIITNGRTVEYEQPGEPKKDFGLLFEPEEGKGRRRGKR